jgi:hypothetical protein
MCIACSFITDPYTQFRWFPVFLSPAPVRNFTLPEFLASKQHWCLHSPLPPTCINPIGWHQTTVTHHCLHSSRYKLCARVPCFLFGFLILEDGTDRLSTETLVRNYHYLLCNNTKERSSHLLHGGNLKSHKNKTDSVGNWSVLCNFMPKTWSFCL